MDIQKTMQKLGFSEAYYPTGEIGQNLYIKFYTKQKIPYNEQISATTLRKLLAAIMKNHDVDIPKVVEKVVEEPINSQRTVDNEQNDDEMEWVE